MAGFYIHIPYCKKICYYCDFHFSLNLNTKNELVKSIVKEIRLRKNYLKGENIDTIYFGGGTPSILSVKEINRIIHQIEKYHSVDTKVECTLEANPDDLSVDYLKSLKSETRINRLSIGVQSFFDDDLQLMNRRHTGVEAVESIKRSLRAGFKNITVDLIYGIPNMTIDRLNTNIQKILDFNINHISAYHLTIEKNTAFNHFLKKGIISPITDDEGENQFKFLIEKLKSAGFQHYEISNFAKGKFISKHNVSYWQQKQYIGVGPSAHSFNFESRQWNIANNLKYIDAISKNRIPAEKEFLNISTKYNEYVMTSLRTMWGINLKFIEKNFGILYVDYCKKNIKSFIDSNHIIQINNYLILSDSGKFISDTIMSELFYID